MSLIQFDELSDEAFHVPQTRHVRLDAQLVVKRKIFLDIASERPCQPKTKLAKRQLLSKNNGMNF